MRKRGAGTKLARNNGSVYVSLLTGAEIWAGCQHIGAVKSYKRERSLPQDVSIRIVRQTFSIRGVLFMPRLRMY